MALICRLCATLKRLEHLTSLVDPNLNLIVKLEKCCQLILPKDDILPKIVCSDCIQTLDNCWKFSEKVRESQESLIRLFLKDEQSSTFKESSSVYIENADSNLASDNSEFYEEKLDEDDDVVSVKSSKENIFFEVEIGVQSDEDLKQENVLEENVLEENDLEENDVINETHVETDVALTWNQYSWKCFICTSIFKTAIQFNEHFRKSHSKLQYYICTDCSKKFDKYYSFLNHVIARHHPSLANCCDLCSKILKNSKDIAKHRLNHANKDEIVICPECGKYFKNDKSLQLHSNCHLPYDMKYKYSCEHCNKRFGTKPNLKAHLKIHTGIKEFICDQCGKSFVQKANLEEHQLIHVDTTPFECQDCGKKFKTSGRLAKHRTVHTDIKPHKCEECGRVFREKDTLRAHLRIHTGEMPYECDICGKRFRFRSVLTTHHHLHTGVRPYSCEDCNHHFTNWPNYNKHMKRRHGIDKSSKSTRFKDTKMSIDQKDTFLDVGTESDLIALDEIVLNVENVLMKNNSDI